MNAETKPETLQFESDATQVLELVTHSLYSKKEIFLRELISNASDALDKLRYEALNDNALYEGEGELKIIVEFDKSACTITLRDNGIGMSKEEVIQNLGTIARSGTKEFLAKLKESDAKTANLIGQFGVGFYSAFVVADKVVVKTRRAGMKEDQGVYWESAGQAGYQIQTITYKPRGTEVILHLKKDEDEFLDDYKLRDIIHQYSDHILFPIEMPKMTSEEEKEKKEKDKAPEYEKVNSATALWTKPRSEIKDEEYNEFYKHISHDYDDALVWAHNKVEGKHEYTSLLFVPKHAPFDLYNREHQHGLKLYIKRVFIMDKAEQLLPLYLRFVRGVVDSSDLPLNVSREILQNNRVIESIKSGCTKRVLSLLEQLSKDDKNKYEAFWKEFGSVLKEGPSEDFANRELIAKLLRFSSTHTDKEEQNVSLEDYLSRMKHDQEKIYYIAADGFSAAKNSPHLEIFRKKGIEVLLLYDRVDEWLMSHLTEFQGKQFQSVAKGDLDIGKLDDMETKEETKKKEKEFESVLKQIKDVLKDEIKDARLTHRLTDSPACLVVDETDMSANLQRMLQAAGQAMPTSNPIMEINPRHPLVLRMKSETNDNQFAEWAHVIFDQALLAEGGQLKDPASFVKRLNTLLMQIR